MNRAFLIALVPPVLAALAYFALAAGFGVRLAYARMFGAALGAIAAIVLVNVYLRRRARAAEK